MDATSSGLDPNQRWLRYERYPFLLAKILTFGLVLFGLYRVLAAIQDVLTPVLVALFLAYLLDPAVDWFEARGHSRTTGIGLFLALIALKSAGIVAPSKATYVTLGNLHSAPVILATLGFLLIVVLDKFRVPGAILIGIIGVTVASFFFGGNQFRGIFDIPPSIAPTFLQLDIKAAVTHGFLNVVLVFFLVELFDATGTLMGVAKRAGLLVPGRMERLNKSLFADSAAIFAGSLLGTSSTTAYIESAAGVQAGGRTGLTALTVAVLVMTLAGPPMVTPVIEPSR